MAIPEKVVVVGPAARERLFAGAFKLAEAVKSTLGPYGANALLEKGMKVTNDGVTIAREIQLKDEIEQLGARKLQEVASATNDEAGDGTTTAITLAYGILKEADKFLPKEKKLGSRTPIQVIQQIEQERLEVTAELKHMAVEVKDEAQLIEVAKVSVEDDELGELIGKAQWELGPEGYLLAEEVNERKSSVEKINGVLIDNGFGTSAIINNNEKQALEVDDIRVLFTNNTVQNLDALRANILQPIALSDNKSIVILCRAFTDVAVQQALSYLNQGITIYPLNAPYTDQAQVMKDLEAVLGGKFVNKEETPLEDIQLTDLGFATKIFAKRSSTVITGVSDEYAKVRIEKRLKELKDKHTGETSEFEKRNLSVRMAQLKNGLAMVKVGGLSDTDRKYKKDKVDDAVNAVRAALQEGIVPGAGQAFKMIADKMPDDSILKKALLAPYTQIRENAPVGFEVPEWVKDPAKVLRIALEKACSVSATLATTNIAIATEKEKPRYVTETKTPDEAD